jgi:predicted dinucleotide-binding enzyme
MLRTIGIIGAGRIAQSIARLLLRNGYQVFISNSRESSSLKSIIDTLGDGAIAVTGKEAAEKEIVILALPWNSLSAVTALTDWKGKLVIDATNHFVNHTPPMQLADLGEKSSSEVTASFVPGARLVKAFNTLYFELLAQDPVDSGGNRVLFISGDDGEVKKIVSELIVSVGFVALDLGSLRTGGRLQQAGGSLAGKNLILLH